MLTLDEFRTYLNKQKASQRLGVSRTTLDRMVARGDITCIWIKTWTGHRYRAWFNPKDLDKWLAKRGREAS